MNSHKILSIAATIVFLTPFPVKAQEKIPHWEVAFSTSNQDNPSATQEGKARCQRCFKNPESQVPLTSILPVIDQRLTVASHPTFFINLPETFAKQVFFKIEAHNEEYEYTTILPITGQKGIMRVTLPPDAPALETGQTYQWFLVLMCQDKLKPDSPAVQGSVKRVSTSITSSEQFTAMKRLEQAQMYAQAGIWYETISILAQLREEQPEDSNLFSIWETVLTSVGLESLAQAELVD